MQYPNPNPWIDSLLLTCLLLLLPLAAVKPLYGVLVEHRPWRQHDLTIKPNALLTTGKEEGKRTNQRQQHRRCAEQTKRHTDILECEARDE